MNITMARSALLLTASVCPIWAGLASAQTVTERATVPTATVPTVPTATGQSGGQTGSAGDIVVTARSRAESLNRVPVSVSALTSKDLAKYAIADLAKLSQQIPQIQIYGNGAGSGGAFLVRGIGTTADTAGVDPSVSLSFDGTQIARPRSIYLGLFDLEQVSVLKGPQALFFGKNSSAGVVSIQSANPTKELSGYAKVGYEFEARERYAEAAFSGPITDTLGFRVAGRFSRLRGWVKNTAGPGPDPATPSIALPGAINRWGPNSREESGRITLRWSPASNYTATLKATFSGYDDDGSTSTLEPVCSGDHPVTNGQVDLTSDCRLNGVKSASAIPPIYAFIPTSNPRWFSGIPYTRVSSELATLQQSLDLGEVTLTSNTGYSHLAYSGRGGFTGTNVGENSGGTDEYFRGWSEEGRLISDFHGPLNFTLGAYYEHSRDANNAAVFLTNLGADPATGSFASGATEAVQRSKTWSVFGQGRWDIADNLELAGGARYTKAIKNVRQGNAFVNPNWGFLYLPQGTILYSRVNEDNVSPEATLTWHPSGNQTLYGAFKTGYKSGGIAQPAVVSTANTAENVVFKPEKSLGGEIGYKAYFFDRRLNLNVSVYHYIFKGLQLTSFDPRSLSYRIQNAADAKQTGAEAELSYRFNQALNVHGALSYNRVFFGSFQNSACYANQTVEQGCAGGVQDLTDKRLHRAPLWEASAGLSYERAISREMRAAFSLDGRFSSSYLTTETQNPVGRQASYALLNASARIHPNGEGWEIALIGSNLTNKRLIGFAQDRTGAVTPGVREIGAYLQRPREIALEASVHF